MPTPASGADIVSAQTNALEGALLLDYVVGQRQQRRWNINIERLRRFEIDYKVKFRPITGQGLP